MIRIRKIFNPNLETNKRYIDQVKEIIRIHFPAVPLKKIEEIEYHMIDPVKSRYQSILFIAVNINDVVLGFGLLLFMSDLQICYLDYIAVSPDRPSSGIGSALYQRIREEADSLNAFGIFFECLPDDATLCLDEKLISQNQKRLAFYEKFGARPIINTLYELPVKPTDDCPPYLVFDGLGKRDTIPNDRARKIMRAILERKYGDYCPVEYIEKVIDSIKDDPVILRPPKYKKKKDISIFRTYLSERNKIFLVINNEHNIHHVRERGYVESPVRIANIQKELDTTGLFRYGTAKKYPDKFILDVHDFNYFNYFKRVCKNLPKGTSVYPYVFPIRNVAKAPKELSVRAGYFCFDTFTPLNQNAYLAARWGVDCTLTAADMILSGNRAAYVLTRPPGHHAEKSVFGGFCYFNNCAIAASYFSKQGKVAILDIDYHHGNGQQQIFYNRNDVLTISIHAHPSFAYPYFSGFSEENGEGSGLGFNINFPLPEKIDYEFYSITLNKALKRIRDHNPEFLIVALGLDTAKGDPTGTWNFSFENFFTTGKSIGELCLPTLIIQEGGYKNLSLGSNARAFFTGFHVSHNNAYPGRNDI